MAIRPAVRAFVELGPLPDCHASVETIRAHERLLEIEGPVSDEEAAVLLRCFGPDDCFGLAWTLLHLIETAPGGIPIKAAPSAQDNEWIQRLWHRSHRE